MTTKLVPLTIGSSGVSGKTVPLGWIVVPVLSEVRESGVYVTFSCEIQATKSSCSEERKASVREQIPREITSHRRTHRRLGAVDHDLGADGGRLVVRARELAGRVPLELNLAAGVRERGPVVAEGRAALGVRQALEGLVDARGSVDDGQGREDLPLERRVLSRARLDVRLEEGPSESLRDADLEIDGHGEEAGELAEGHLLTRLGRDRLDEELGRRPGRQVREEAEDARLAPAGELLAEVDLLGGQANVSTGTYGRPRQMGQGKIGTTTHKLRDGVKVVLVRAPLGRASHVLGRVEHVRDEGGVADLNERDDGPSETEGRCI
jgi:hypothetical protein